eukprot:EG_transcript_15786
MPSLREAQRHAELNGIPWDDVVVQSLHHGSKRCFNVEFQGFTLTIQGEEKKKLVKELNGILILLFTHLHRKVDENEIDQFAQQHQLEKPGLTLCKAEDGGRLGQCEMNNVKFSVVADSKKELKRKIRTASLVLLHQATELAGRGVTRDEPPATDESGKKDSASTGSLGSPFGTSNDWTKADLGDQSRNSKFLALMGATKADSHKAKCQVAEAEQGSEPKAKKQKKEKKEKEEKLIKKDRSEQPEDAEPDQSAGVALEPALHQSMAGWFVPPSSGAYHTLKASAPAGPRKYFVVMPGDSAPAEKASAIDHDTSQKIKEDLQKGFNAAMKVRSLGVAGLGFQHYTHEQFSKNKVEGTKVLFD